MDKNQILDQLKQINYPGFNRDIVSFGMVKEVVIDQKNITIMLAISSSNEEKKNQLVQDISNSIQHEGYDTKIKVLEQAPTQTVDTSNKGANVEGNIKNIIAVASGKGGVGKSTIALNLAAALSKTGHKTGLLDLDIYGPSLPITMGINQNPAVNDQQKIIPVTKDNLKLMSFGFISGNQAPVVWRGPLVAKMTEQFFKDVIWGELDFLILDLPPGTGDVQLTLSQKIPLDGAIIVTTPNDIALTDVRKGADMFNKVKTPLLGVVENMSYMEIAGKLKTSSIKPSDIELQLDSKVIPLNEDFSFKHKFHLFKQGGGLNESKRLDIPLLAEIPYSEDLMLSIDKGEPLVFADENHPISEIFTQIANSLKD
jgi:ATP-binding protein involved in chromosome partitioning|tara:strand:- start:39 stop:1145 length:1107 start_codon:yes stop_codon:yes gene_type:complete